MFAWPRRWNGRPASAAEFAARRIFIPPGMSPGPHVTRPCQAPDPRQKNEQHPMTATGPAHDAKPRKLKFTVAGDGEDVPAVAWLPGRPAAQRPLVLLGHGGGLHKEAPYIARPGNWLASGPGYAALAIDLPFHGDRTPAEEKGLSAVERRSRMGLRAWRERNSRATGQAVADWKAAITAVQHLDPAVHAPIGYPGFSMGTRFGIPWQPPSRASPPPSSGCSATRPPTPGPRSPAPPGRSPSPSFTSSSGTTSCSRERTASPCSTCSPPRTRPCTSTPAAISRSRPPR